MVFQSIFFIGVLLIFALLLKPAAASLRIPGLVGWILLGTAFRFVLEKAGLLSGQSSLLLNVLSKIGVIVLLFTVGLESKLFLLLAQIHKATFIWFCNIVLSGLLGFFVGKLMGLGDVPSIIIGVALTATSTGVSVGVWQEQKKVSTPEGQLLIDLAEMDDISGVLALSFIFAVLPAFMGQSPQQQLWGTVAKTVFILLAKLAGLGIVCLVFSRFLLKPILKLSISLTDKNAQTLLLFALGLIIAAIAGLLDLSLALGAFFAGLSFSLNKELVKEKEAFRFLQDLFIPFFFIGIGFNVSLQSIGEGMALGLALSAAAVVGKWAGTTIPALAYLNKTGAILLGISMVPRAEITMVVASKAVAKNGLFPRTAFSGMVIVVLLTCLLSPFVIRKLLIKIPD